WRTSRSIHGSRSGTPGLIWVRQGPLRVLIANEQPADYATTSEIASVQQDDVILAVNEQGVDWWLAQRWRTWPTIWGRWQENGATVEITLQRGQDEQTGSVPLSVRPKAHVASQLLTHMILSLAYLMVAGILLKARSSEATARLAATVLILLAFVQQTDVLILFGIEWAMSMLWLFLPLRLLTRWFAYAAALHFCLTFPISKPWINRFRWLPLVIYGLNPLVSLTIMFSTVGNLHERHGAAYSWSKNIYLLYLLLATLALLHTYLTSKTPLVKTQMRWMVWGAMMASLPNILLVDIPILIFDQRLLPVELSGFLLLMIPAVIMVTVMQYRLWDVSLVIRASLIYGILSLLLGASYLILISALVGLIGVSSSRNGITSGSPSVYFVAAFILVLLFNPLQKYLQRFIDRTFYRDKPNYTKILNELSYSFVTSIELNDVITLLLDRLPEKLGLDGAEVILETLPDQDSPEYQTLQKGKLVWLYQLTGEPLPVPSPLSDLQAFGMWVCAPLIAGGDIHGLYGLGPKKSGEFYSADDIALIETLSRQAGIALENATLNAQIMDRARLERDLEIAQQIQLSLLPDHDPVHSHLDIAGYSIPAQSVGGDFYHYVDYEDGQLGIAVGDVSGKGVSAALLMAVSVSNLRAHAPRYTAQTYHLLAEMNQLLRQQTEISKVNVAMLYAIIRQDANDALRFNVSNGGLVSPILRREGQRSEFLDACGLPLGIIREPNYYECSFKLFTGDLIVLCSDGIVEAMNEHHDMFGFDQLLKIIDQAPDHLTASDFITYIRQEVATFTGDAPQLDDITIVAVKAV
ncbi:MAG: GAF domain-containing SpoIIE family protein phosphatase, partial [Chloroflexota bacterium]